MRNIRPHAFLIAATMAAVTLVLAPGAASAAAPKPYLAGAFSQRTVERFTRDLANAGVGVYPARSNRPLRRIRGVPSPLRMQSAQVRAAALGAAAKTGVSGATLNATVGSVRLSPKHSIPAGALVAGWARRARTPKAALARRILGRPEWRNYEQVVFPHAVLLLYAADTATQIQAAARTLPPGRARSRALAAFARAAAASGPCSAVLQFVDTTINKFFDALGDVLSKKTIQRLLGKNWVSDVVGAAVDFVFGPVRLVIEGARRIVLETVRIPIGLVTNMIAGVGAAVGVAGTVANAVNVWSGKIQAVPDPTGKIVGAGVPGVFRLKVTAPGGDLSWPGWITDCARVFNFPLPTLTPKRAAVEWNVGAQQPGGLIVRGTASGPLDDTGAASLTYETTSETPEQAQGRLAVGTVLAVATVRRNDLNELIEAITNRLFRVLPSFVEQHLGAALRNVVQPLIHTIKESIGRLKDIEANGLLRVRYHTTEPPKPKNPVPGVVAAPTMLALPEPCTLITQAEASAATGRPANPGVPGTSTDEAGRITLTCAFQDPQPFLVGGVTGAFVALSVRDLGTDATAQFTELKTGATTTPGEFQSGAAPGLGDDNFYLRAPEGTTILYARRANIMLTVTVITPDGLNQSIALARLALGRF